MHSCSPAHRKGFDALISSTFVVNIIDEGFGVVEVVVLGAMTPSVVLGAATPSAIPLTISSTESSFEEKSALKALRSAWICFSVDSLAYLMALLRRRRRA